jgi:hypothetical protein
LKANGPLDGWKRSPGEKVKRPVGADGVPPQVQTDGAARAGSTAPRHPSKARTSRPRTFMPNLLSDVFES